MTQAQSQKTEHYTTIDSVKDFIFFVVVMTLFVWGCGYVQSYLFYLFGTF